MHSPRRTLKRGITLFMILIVAGSVLSIAPPTVSAQDSTQETEPNDAPKGGTPVVGGEINGSLDPAKLDWDWYVVRAEKGETIEATMNFETVGNADFEMRLESSNGTELDTADESSPQIGVAATAPETGLYYIGVTSFYYRDEAASPNTLPYTLTASPVMNSTPSSFTGSSNLTDQPRSEQEPNGDRDNATRPQGAPITGTMSSDNDTDVFAIDAEAGERIEVLVEFEEFNNDSYMRMNMRGPDGYIGPFEPSQTDRRVQMATIAERSGTYYFQLAPTRPPENVNYTVTMFTAGGQGNTTEATTTGGPSTGGTQTTTAPSTTAGTDEQSEPLASPPGYSSSGIPNTTAAIEQHFSTLFGYESFTFTSQAPFLVSSGPGTTRISSINITNRSGFATINSSIPGEGGHARREYWTNGTYYAVFDSFNDTVGYQGYPQTYQRYLGDAAGRTPPSVSVIPNLLNNARFELAERIYGQSMTYFRYNSTEPTNGTNLLPALIENATVDDFNASIIVDENGVIRSSAYAITYTRSDGEQVTARASTRVTAINNTTAKSPPWLPEAKASLATTDNTTILGIEGSVERPSELGAITSNSTAGGNTDATGQSARETATETKSDGESATDGTDPTAEDSKPTAETTAGSAGTTTSSSGPGFGVVIAISGLLVGFLTASRRIR